MRLSAATDPSAPPSRELLLLEVRAVWELTAFFATYPMLRLAPRGDGHAVLVLPGLAASDTSTRPLRRFLTDQGWAAHGWALGANHGPRPGVEAKMQERLASIFRASGRKVSLIGWSLGGIFAREMARRAPEQVRTVITLGSPFAGAPRASSAWQLYERPWREHMKTPPPVPATAIFSRSDGIVAWQGCLEREGPQTENIEVEGSHCGLGHNPVVLYAIADRLTQPEGRWQRFDRSGLRSFVYPDPHRAPATAGLPAWAAGKTGGANPMNSIFDARRA
jgi:pimeloyl-ACP methyl ester carboxylesterase